MSSTAPATLRIASWNVNGLRACLQKGLLKWLRRCGMDIVALQETRVHPADVPAEIRRLRAWHWRLVEAEKKGYSGVGLLSRAAPDRYERTQLAPPFDAEGRLMRAWFGDVQLVNSYFPNGAGRDRDNSRIPFKLDYYRALFALLQPACDAGQAVVVVGDFNTAHQDIDLARPKQNVKTSGFCPEERQELDRWLRAGWVDAYRRLHPDRAEYSWWSSRYGVREKNIGWRIDYTLLSPAAALRLRDARILTRVKGSDHCPVVVELESASSPTADSRTDEQPPDPPNQASE